MTKRMKDWSVRTKLLSAFLGVALLSGVVGLFARDRLLQVEQDIHEIRVLGKDAGHLADLEVLVLESLKAERSYVLTGKPEFLESYKKFDQEIGEGLRTLRNVATERQDTEELRNLEKFEGELRDYERNVTAIQGSITEKTLDTATEEAIKKTAVAGEQMLAVVREIITAHDKVVDNNESDAMATANGAIHLIYGVTILSLLVGVVLGMFLTRMITRPLQEMVGALAGLAQGDLSRTLSVRSHDEFGVMARAFNQTMHKLGAVVGQVMDAARHVSSASTQLAAASEELSTGSQQQASALEETAASLEEMSGTIKQNAENAQQANQFSVGSREMAEKGAQVTTSAAVAMQEINQSSKKIGEISTVINEIAFQTNLLALNAAVEAARAGEQGRGFAVVAAEVRNLAQRSATAAKEIKNMIQDSVQKMGDGSALVTKSGQALEEIVGSVKRVTDIVGEIAAASREQSSGIDQVNKAVTQMDQVIQGTAAQTEELSSTAQALAAQAEELEATLGQFTLSEEARRQVMTRPAETQPLVKINVAKPKAVAMNGDKQGYVNGHAKGYVNGRAQGQAGGFEEF